MHKTQKPSVSQGLNPILLLALLASMTSAYTCLGVSQDWNPRHQLLKASVYHSATSAVLKTTGVGGEGVRRMLGVSGGSGATSLSRSVQRDWMASILLGGVSLMPAMAAVSLVVVSIILSVAVISRTGTA
jgi:hypothetical protein